MLLEVTDSGSGIAPEHLPRLFEPFFTTKEYGTGLGLTNVRRLVEDNGGKIDVRSKPGEGSTFALHLPAATSTEEEQAPIALHGSGSAEGA